MTDVSLSEVLAENYLSIGATGLSAIASMWDDLLNDRFDKEWLDEMNTTYTQLVAELLSITTDIVSNAKLHTMIGV